MTDTAVQQWTQEQVDRLARDFMRYGYSVFDGQVWRNAWPWNPFADASHDYEVLQRARNAWFATDVRALALRDELWRLWHSREPTETYPESTLPILYQVGDYARGVLAVLDSQRRVDPRA
jgi:hypothetical protein